MSREYTVADYMIREQAVTRHRAVADVVQWLDFSHLPTGLPRGVAERCAELASAVLDVIPVDDPELTRGLSALVQVKDHFVRAAIVAQRGGEGGRRMSETRKFRWDWRGQPPMGEIMTAVAELSGGAVEMAMPETGSDEYELIVAQAAPPGTSGDSGPGGVLIGPFADEDGAAVQDGPW